MEQDNVIELLSSDNSEESIGDDSSSIPLHILKEEVEHYVPEHDTFFHPDKAVPWAQLDSDELTELYGMVNSLGRAVLLSVDLIKRLRLRDDVALVAVYHFFETFFYSRQPDSFTTWFTVPTLIKPDEINVDGIEIFEFCEKIARHMLLPYENSLVGSNHDGLSKKDSQRSKTYLGSCLAAFFGAPLHRYQLDYKLEANLQFQAIIDLYNTGQILSEENLVPAIDQVVRNQESAAMNTPVPKRQKLT